MKDWCMGAAAWFMEERGQQKMPAKRPRAHRRKREENEGERRDERCYCQRNRKEKEAGTEKKKKKKWRQEWGKHVYINKRGKSKIFLRNCGGGARKNVWRDLCLTDSTKCCVFSRVVCSVVVSCVKEHALLGELFFSRVYKYFTSTLFFVFFSFFVCFVYFWKCFVQGLARFLHQQKQQHGA